METSRQSEDSFEKALGPVPRIPRMRLDGAHTRYVKGGHRSDEVHDLRPQPLYTGDTSLLEILKEGPPADLDSLNIYAIDDPKPSATVKKDGDCHKKSFGSLRKIFSPKLKNKKSKLNVLDFSEGLEGNHPSRPPNHPGPSYRQGKAHQAFSFADMDQFEKIANEYTKYRPDPSPPLLTPQTSSSDSNTPDLPLVEQDWTEHSRLSTDKHGSTIALLGISHKSDAKALDLVDSSCTSTLPGVSKSPTALPGGSDLSSPTMARPELLHRVTEDHLKLTNYPPVSKEDLAQLPKDLEATLPLSRHDSLDARHPTRPSFISIGSIVQQGPADEGNNYGNTRLCDRRQHSFPYSIQSGHHNSEVSRRHNTAPITDNRTTPEEFLGFPLPPLNLRKNGKVKPYKSSDPMMRILDATAYEELYGREAALAKYAPPGIIDAAMQKAEVAKAKIAEESIGLGISTHDYAHGSIEEGQGHIRESSKGSIETPVRTPVTPRSGLVTPQSPGEFFDFYKTLSQTSQEGNVSTMPCGSDQQVYPERGVSSALASIREGEVVSGEQAVDIISIANGNELPISLPSTPHETSSFGNSRLSVAIINAQFGDYRPSSMWTNRRRDNQSDARQGVVRISSRLECYTRLIRYLT
ncbi:MAG: hypothetical protein Q9220_000083 [cf. Caloplaca sp. 1 TL-2023]